MDHVTTLMDPTRALEFVTAINVKRHLILGYVFRRTDYPWLQTWGDYPPTGNFARGMELSTQPFDVPRREAVDLHELFETPTYKWLPAKSTLETRFLLFYAHTPPGFDRVDDVHVENGRLIVEDRAAHKQISLGASLASELLRP
jgi:hypothetical protein